MRASVTPSGFRFLTTANHGAYAPSYEMPPLTGFFAALVCRILSRPRVGVATKQVVSGISEGAGGGFRVLKF